MKYLLYLLLISNYCVAQHDSIKTLWSGNAIGVYSFAFAAGVSDGLNDCIIANKFYSAPFWGYADWQKHGNIDGFHVTKGCTYLFWSGAIVFGAKQKLNWKLALAEGLISLAVSRGAHELTYNVVFKNYPR